MDGEKELLIGVQMLEAEQGFATKTAMCHVEHGGRVGPEIGPEGVEQARSRDATGSAGHGDRPRRVLW